MTALPILARTQQRQRSADAMYAAVALCPQHRDRARRWRDVRYDPVRSVLSRALLLDSRQPPQGTDGAVLLDRLKAEQIHLLASICADRCDIRDRQVVAATYTRRRGGRTHLVIPQPQPVLAGWSR